MHRNVHVAIIVYILLDSVAMYMDVLYTNNDRSTELQSYAYSVTKC